jgi:hypothetical protein
LIGHLELQIRVYKALKVDLINHAIQHITTVSFNVKNTQFVSVKCHHPQGHPLYTRY